MDRKIEPIYLDHNAATFAAPEVIAAIHEYLLSGSGNPSSIHSFGRKAQQALTKSRDAIARFLEVRPDEIMFTSGATEGANLMIRGLLQLQPNGHVISSSAEHSCVYNTLKLLEKQGTKVTFLDPGPYGAVTPDQVREALRSDTCLIALMAANNETGVKTDLAGVARIAQEAKIPFFVDAVALLGKERFRIPPGVSAMCFSGQKIHAPQGIGFCFVRKNLKFTPLITGGAQQYGRRAGTENVPGIVGLAKAVELLERLPNEAYKQMHALRDYFESELKRRVGAEVNGEGERVGNTSNLYFPGVEGEALLAMLDLEGVAASHGSACSSGALEPSRILTNMALGKERVRASLRFSISRFTTKEEIDRALDIIEKVARKLRK